jgi:predicted dithiol-disulfide oxidoreductase (DUF899 family)
MPNVPFRHTNLREEPAEYLVQREELRLAEIDLMHQRERVAELRRRLPVGALIEDYVFEEGPASLNAGDAPVRTVRLSELFTAPDRPLVVYHLMYGKKQSKRFHCELWKGHVGRVEVDADQPEQSFQRTAARRRNNRFVRPLVSAISAVV